MNHATVHRIFSEGIQAYKDNPTDYKCPYPNGSQESKEWYRGIGTAKWEEDKQIRSR